MKIYMWRQVAFLSINQSIKRIKIIDYHSIKLKKYSKKWVLAILKSSCRDCSTKSSTDFAHYYLWLFSTLWRNTSHPFQNLQKKFQTPPPTSPFSKCKCHVTFPYFYFHFKETACSSNFKEAQIPVDFSVPTKQVLTGVEHKLREKGRWLHWHSSPISPYCTCQAIVFLLVMYHPWSYWFPKLCVSSTLFYVFYTPRKKWYK